MADASEFGDELRHLVTVAVTLFGLGLMVSFSPTVIGLALDALKRGSHTWRVVLIVTGATILTVTVLALLFTVVSPNAIVALWTGHVRSLLLQRWLDAVVGIVLLVVGVIQWRRASLPRQVRRRQSHLEKPQVLAALVVASTLASTTNPPTIYLAVRSIGTTRPELWLLDYAVFATGLSAPYVMLGYALPRMPRLARRLSLAMAWIGARDLRRPVAVLLLATGVALVTWAGWKLFKI